ncbi:MAG: c-type cytochrome [Planctomycetota bacterium]|nr:c-type cytochrome [Planctomycetota bacterium]
MKLVVALLACFAGILATGRHAVAQPGLPSFGLERQLLSESPEALVQAARESGDPVRGAIAFHQPYASCTKCHTAGENDKPLGPDLAKSGKELKPTQIVESILDPSKTVKKGFETITITTVKGKALSGLLVEDRADAIVYRSLELGGKTVTLAKSDVDEFVRSKQSIMPKGLVNQLSSRQQFLDLVRYLIEITEQGPQRALQLRPNPSLYAARALPAYEQHIDHAGIIGSLDNAAFKRGEAIYNRLCINCHGTRDRPGSLPTSLRFATGKFKNGGDPFTMYQTLTRGFGMMVPQTWMVPQQKYDVIHYIREAYLKPHNPSQLFAITNDYTSSLPKGDTRGPAPSNDEPWILMDYGPSLIASYELSGADLNFAYKGVAMRCVARPTLDDLRSRHAANVGGLVGSRIHRLERHYAQRTTWHSPAIGGRSAGCESDWTRLGESRNRRL